MIAWLRAGLVVAALAAGCATGPATPPVLARAQQPAWTSPPGAPVQGTLASETPDLPSGPDEDGACLRELSRRRQLFVRLGPVRGVRTPVIIAGPVGGVNLLARAGRPAVMDCQLARALVQVAPIFREAGVGGLSFSGAYDYRTRRGSGRLSAHASGLAIDVHTLQTRRGDLEVARDYARSPRRWQALETDGLAGCIGGKSRRPGGRVLRTLACRLKLHPAVRVILTPDDNRDHRDHLHIETHPTAAPLPLAAGAGARKGA